MFVSAAALNKTLRVVGALYLSTGLIMGALIAHLPGGDFAPQGQMFATRAMNLQMEHGLAFITLGLLLPTATWIIRIGEIGLLLGTILFCGSVYFKAFTDHHLFHLAPTGGMLLIASWLVIAIGWLIEKSQPQP